MKQPLERNQFHFILLTEMTHPTSWAVEGRYDCSVNTHSSVIQHLFTLSDLEKEMIAWKKKKVYIYFLFHFNTFCLEALFLSHQLLSLYH